jgi:polysaccharide biosynthesis PFTS motif protein
MFGLPERRFKSYMGLYSLNSHPLVFKDDPIDVPYPASQYLFVDKIWIWHESYKQLLLKDGIMTETEVKDPILWYLPEHNERVENNDFRICIFDITPRSKKFLLDVTGNSDSYYSMENIKKFYDDILYAIKYAQDISEKAIKVLVKRKREGHFGDDEEYNRYLDKLNNEQENLIFIDYDFNLYSLIERCALSISIPFASPAYLANYMKKPALYYDPTDSILFNHPNEPMIQFVSDRDQLAESILSLIRTHR